MGSLLQCEDTGLPIDVPCLKPESAEDVTVYTTTACTTAVCSARQPALEITGSKKDTQVIISLPTMLHTT